MYLNTVVLHTNGQHLFYSLQGYIFEYNELRACVTVNSLMHLTNLLLIPQTEK